jgi:hypothetical protein
MSLTSFIVRPEVVARIKLLRPNISRKIAIALKVAPRSNHYMLVGALSITYYVLNFNAEHQTQYRDIGSPNLLPI